MAGVEAGGYIQVFETSKETNLSWYGSSKSQASQIAMTKVNTNLKKKLIALSHVSNFINSPFAVVLNKSANKKKIG